MKKLGLVVLVNCLLLLTGCGLKQSATYDISSKKLLRNISVLDNRSNAAPLPEKSSGRFQRVYFDQKALGPDMLDIVKARLAIHDAHLASNISISIDRIELSIIKVDNDMGGNSSDSTAGNPFTVFVPDIGALEFDANWLRAKSLVSVRSTFHYSIGSQVFQETEYGMSTYSKMEPEIQSTLYKSIDLIAEKFKP